MSGPARGWAAFSFSFCKHLLSINCVSGQHRRLCCCPQCVVCEGGEAPLVVAAELSLGTRSSLSHLCLAPGVGACPPLPETQDC